MEVLSNVSQGVEEVQPIQGSLDGQPSLHLGVLEAGLKDSTTFSPIKKIEKPTVITLDSVWTAIVTLESAISKLTNITLQMNNRILVNEEVAKKHDEKLLEMEQKVTQMQKIQINLIQGDKLQNRNLEKLENEARSVYGALDPIFNDRVQFPSLYRTVPDDRSQYEAIIPITEALWLDLVVLTLSDLKGFNTATKVLTNTTLNHQLKNIHFRTSAGDEIFFDDEGKVPGQFDIINWLIFPNGTVKNVQIGSFTSSAPVGHQLLINVSAIEWGPNIIQTPHSVCTESCTPGYRKAPRKGQPVCCYDCVPCSEGEITTMIDMETCEPCPEDQWSNEKRDLCIPRDIVFLSYQEPLGVALASVAILFCLITAAVMAIFIKHHKTPLVKANNSYLSYMLLLSLILSFLCSLLFIGHPLKVTCLLQQPVFGIIFTVAVSTVLAKTIKVAIAFNATKPNSKLKKWLDARVSNYIILLCSLGEVLICLVWLLISPPFPDYDTKSESGKMILKCNYGSGIAFYLVVGYMGGLAFLSFVVAFLVRKLPDSFNETQLITFSMLVFCTVWVSFIPVYLSTKGRYMVAVEIFAILTSSAGLLVFIFIPKCYIILFKPEMNTRKHLMGKQSNNDNF
ncbi:vomeronasal type-2 receptor 116-like [Rhinatrema bivittatum]|uniref:vomeronasal type-2 receptor 116-like n=1 Tax=Rhinatrema bivittatum TaxID=194408 RepID=UPI0011284E7F|nr:vomeronasal type-2 receptor 116-like [Rhinatrema bivittatum]